MQVPTTMPNCDTQNLCHLDQINEGYFGGYNHAGNPTEMLHLFNGGVWLR